MGKIRKKVITENPVNLSVETLHYWGTGYPIREIDGLKVSVKRLEDRLLDECIYSEAAELLNSIAGFLTYEEIYLLSDEEILQIIN